MFIIKAFTTRQYYHSRYGEKCYVDTSDKEANNTYMQAAWLTGKGLKSEEQLIYTAYGEDQQEAQKSLDNYLKSNPDHLDISRTEDEDSDYPVQDDIWPSRRWNKEKTDYIDLSGMNMD